MAARGRGGVGGGSCTDAAVDEKNINGIMADRCVCSSLPVDTQCPCRFLHPIYIEVYNLLWSQKTTTRFHSGTAAVYCDAVSRVAE